MKREGKNMNGRNRGDVRAVELENARSSEKIGGGGTPLLRTFSKENSRGSGSIWTAHKGSFFSARNTNKESPPETSNEQRAASN